MTDDLTVTRPNLPTETGGEPDRVYQLISLGMQQGTDPAALTELYGLYKDAMATQARQEWARAMTRFQSECPPILRSAQGHHGRYADFGSIMKTIRPHLEDAGLSVTFGERPDCGEDRICLDVYVRHTGGHTEVTHVAPLPMDRSGSKNNLQGMGSSMSYAKRYGLILALNLQDTGEVDNDGAGGFIEPEQAKALELFAESIGADKDKFLAWLGVTAFETIPASAYDKARRGLESKVAKSVKPQEEDAK